MSLNVPQKRIENLKTELDKKQNKLVAGTGITIDNTDPESPIISSEGSQGTIDYSELENKPTINAVTLNGNKTAKDLSLFDKTTLVAGKNVTIDEVLPEGGIDEHTLSCWHLDRSGINAIAGKPNYPFTAYNFVNSIEPFNRCLQMYSGTSTTKPFISNDFKTKDFTFDFRFKHELTTGTALILMLGLDYNEDPYIIFNSENTRFIAGSALDVTKSYTPNNWIHIASVRKNGIVSFFLNGEKIGQVSWNKDISALGYWQQVTSEATKYYIDEIRISDIARWDANFTIPTEPYTIAEPTGQYAINATAEPYNLPIASSDALGGIKPGTGVEVTSEGVLNNTGYSSNDFTTPLKVKLNGIEEEATKILVDGTTITKGESTISVIGTKTKNNVLKYEWIGTKAEYEASEAAGTINPDWLCYITDDINLDNLATIEYVNGVIGDVNTILENIIGV